MQTSRDDAIRLPPSSPGGLARRAERWCRALLAEAGIGIDGREPWDMRVNDPALFGRILRHGSLGLGEAYMDGWWDCPQLDEFFVRALRAGLERRVRGPLATLGAGLLGALVNRQSARRAWIVGRRHYDLGNALFSRVLDPTMSYSCGYWRSATDLAQAQRDKLALIAAKLQLAPGMRLLDIGCGWGGLAEHLAREHGAEVLGVTVSTEQAEHARRRCAGLPVEIRLADYRTVAGRFERIVSVGMFEHVGHRNYRTYFELAHRCLAEGGLFLLHTIGAKETVRGLDPWIEKYIFPNGALPSATQIARAVEGLFVIEDWHNFGADYDRTLMAWHANFERAWAELAGHYDERFHRMFRYYLLACAGAFRARDLQLWQVTLSKGGVAGGYRAPR